MTNEKLRTWHMWWVMAKTQVHMPCKVDESLHCIRKDFSLSLTPKTSLYLCNSPKTLTEIQNISDLFWTGDS